MSSHEPEPRPAQAEPLAEIKWLEQALISMILLSGVDELFDEDGELVEIAAPPEDIDGLRKELDLRSGSDPRTVYGLARKFGLEPVARDVLLLTFAPELDPENRMGFMAASELLSPDGRPTVGLVVNLLAEEPAQRMEVRATLARRGRLRRYRLVDVIQSGGAAEADAVITLPPTVRDLLLGHGSPVPGKTVQGVAQEASPEVPAVLRSEPPVPVLVVGEHPGDRRATAAALAAREDLPALIRRIPPADTRPTEAAAIAELVRDARLHEAVAVAELDDIDQRFQAPLLSYVLSDGAVPLDGLVLALPHDVSGAVPEASSGCVICDAQPVDYDAQRKRWSLGLASAGVDDVDDVDDVNDVDDADDAEAWLDHLAGRFRLEPWAIRAAVDRARISSGSNKLGLAALVEAARSMAGRRAVSHARRVRPHYRLQDMVLPPTVSDHLSLLIGFATERERLLHQYGYAQRFTIGHGLVVLLSGESGTGKTMAGEVLANALDRDLYIVDLSQLVSKWVGETEKHIDQVFTEAEEAHGVLLFDEADALFGNRTSDVSSSNDRHANLEVGYLLQRVESFRGVAVLTTNLSQNIDDAFKRRFHFRLDLPRPTPDLRQDLWQTMLPAESCDKASLELNVLAHRFDFTGGNIRNALLKATYLADQESRPLSQHHLMEAAATEAAELGRLVEWTV